MSPLARMSMGSDQSVAKLRGLLTTAVNFRDVSVTLNHTPLPSMASVVSEMSDGEPIDSEALALEMCNFGTGIKKNKLVLIMVRTAQ